MRTLFDTSVVIPALLDEHKNHEAAFHALQHCTSGENTVCCSTHTLAEFYSVVSAGRVAAITPEDTGSLVEALVQQVSVVPLDADDYLAVIHDVAALGLKSGIIYDALHLRCAKKQGVDQILTYNLSDFERFDLDGIPVMAP